jgi:hypothetical protein
MIYVLRMKHNTFQPWHPMAFMVKNIKGSQQLYDGYCTGVYLRFFYFLCVILHAVISMILPCPILRNYEAMQT